MILKKLLISLITIFAFSCSSEMQNGGLSDSVGIMVSQSNDVKSRTTVVGGDESIVRWSNDDVIKLWATSNGGSTYIIDGANFALNYYSPSFDKAFFIGNATGQGNGVDYTYFGVYPLPESTSGTDVTFNLPIEQSGVYDGDLDIMAANPVVGSKLVAQSENHDLNLVFRHLTHAIRFQVPSDDRYTMEHKINKIDITFPQQVVGTLKFNAELSGAVPQFSGGSNKVTLNFKNPITTGDYFWVFINPTTLDGDITIEPYSNDYIAQPLTTTLDNRAMLAGHVTPITLTIKEEARTTLALKINSNNLGEPLTAITLKAPDGAKFRDGSTEYKHTFTDQANIIYLEYYDRVYGNTFKTNGLGVEYESENILMSGTNIPLSSVVGDVSNSVNINVPYIMDYDFSCITADGNIASDLNGDKTNSGIPGLPGWVGASRSHWFKNTNIAISSYKPVFGGYYGRINGPVMSMIKAGKTVKLRISFSVSTQNSDMDFFFGRATTVKYSDGGINASSGNISSGVSSTSKDISGFTSTQRIAWQTSGDIKTTGTSASAQRKIYFDNLKVSIVK